MPDLLQPGWYMWRHQGCQSQSYHHPAGKRLSHHSRHEAMSHMDQPAAKIRAYKTLVQLFIRRNIPERAFSGFQQ